MKKVRRVESTIWSRSFQSKTKYIKTKMKWIMLSMSNDNADSDIDTIKEEEQVMNSQDEERDINKRLIRVV